MESDSEDELPLRCSLALEDTLSVGEGVPDRLSLSNAVAGILIGEA